MGILDLIRRHQRSNGGTSAVTGMPPAGARVPGTGDGHTRTDRKVRLDKQTGSHRAK